MSKTKDNKLENVLYSPVNNNADNYYPQSAELPLIGIRHYQVLLLFIMVFTSLGFNVTLSVAIVAMQDKSTSKNPDIPTYQLDNPGAILSAFFWGYILPQIFAGYAANRFGAKWFLVGTMSITSLLAFLMPFTVAHLGSMGVCASRALQGFCQGFVFPSLTHQLGQWVPIEERSRLGAFAFGAGPLGTVVAMLVTGVISSSWYGWPLVFYVYGAIGLIWCLLFGIFGSNNPAEHPNISDEEKLFIEQSLGHAKDGSYHRNKVPWNQIFHSVPVWALLAAQSGYIYCSWTLLSQIPTYMDRVMQFDIRNNGVLSALPFLTLWILSFFFSFVSDWLINKNVVRIGTARKLFNSIGLFTCAIALTALGCTKSDQQARAIVLLVCAVGATASCMSGWSINHIDLSPNYAGTLMGLTNGFAHISAILAPLIVQFVVKDQTDPHQWRIVFFLAAAIATIAATIFILFGSGTVQKWNENDAKKTIPNGQNSN